MARFLATALATASLFVASPALAAEVFDDVGDTATFSFDGTEAGLAASLFLTLIGEDAG